MKYSGFKVEHDFIINPDGSRTCLSIEDGFRNRESAERWAMDNTIDGRVVGYVNMQDEAWQD